MGQPKASTPSSANPAEYATPVVTSDTDKFTTLPRALYVGTGGDLAVTMPDDAVVTFKNVPSGSFFPVRVAAVKKTGTTATDLLALY